MLLKSMWPTKSKEKMENTVWKINLSEEENALFELVKQFNREGDFDKNTECLNASCQLTLKLFSDDKIPQSRLDYFFEKEYNLSNSKASRKDVFEKNGTRELDIFKHGNFIKYLTYFVEGADLNAFIKEKAVELITNSTYKDDGCKAFCTFLESNYLVKKEDFEEFFKLSIDADAGLIPSTDLRNKIMKLYTK